MAVTRADAVDIAAKATGLRPDQVRAAVEEYRTAAQAVELAEQARPKPRAI